MSGLEIAALIVALLLFITGVVGSFVPVLPGAPLIWLGMIIYGAMTGFRGLTWWFFTGQALLALAVMGIDYLASAVGSRYFGGGKAAFYGAMLGLLAGVFIGPVGLLVGPFAGAVIAELIFGRKTDQALRAGLGAFIGFWGGMPVKLLLEA
ncbi:MAG TPA: DUF456 family protein, partial [Bacillota bacterium]|nr:DUF456 family protein [Bacillota bacterium]